MYFVVYEIDGVMDAVGRPARYTALATSDLDRAVRFFGEARGELFKQMGPGTIVVDDYRGINDHNTLRKERVDE